MSHEKKILTDVDGVLVNWEDAFTSWMSKRNYYVVQPKVYNQYTRYGITKEESDALVTQFNEMINAKIFDSSPNVLSLGQRCVTEGYEFWWPPHSLSPRFTTPSGEHFFCEVDAFVPQLPVTNTSRTRRRIAKGSRRQMRKRIWRRRRKQNKNWRRKDVKKHFSKNFDAPQRGMLVT